MISIERTHEFAGRYHVLGGALSPIDGIDPEDLKITELYARVRDGGVREVVIATNSTTTGEATALQTGAAARSWSPPRAWLDLAATLDEHGDLVAVRIGPAGTRGRDAHGITHELKRFDLDAIALLIAFLDARSVEDGARGTAPVTRFASPSLTYEVFGPSDVQIHRWRSAPSWRSALGPS